MARKKVEQWSSDPEDNGFLAADGGWPENMERREVNDTARMNLASLREWYGSIEWTNPLTAGSDPFTITRTDDSQFRVTLAGDTTADTFFPIGALVKLTKEDGSEVYYGFVSVISGPSAGSTTVTLVAADGTVGKVSTGFDARSDNEETLDIGLTFKDAEEGGCLVASMKTARMAAFRHIATSDTDETGTARATGSEGTDLVEKQAFGSGAFYDTGEDNGLDADTVDGQHASDFITSVELVSQNHLINPNFAVYQRGSPTDSGSEYGNGDAVFTADCWRLLVGEPKAGNAAHSDLPKFTQKTFNVDGADAMGEIEQSSAASDRYGLFQILERCDTATLRGSTVRFGLELRTLKSAGDSSKVDIGNIRMVLLSWEGTENEPDPDPIKAGGWDLIVDEEDYLADSLSVDWNFIGNEDDYRSAWYENLPTSPTADQLEHGDIGYTNSRKLLTASPEDGVLIPLSCNNLGILIYIHNSGPPTATRLTILKLRLELGGGALSTLPTNRTFSEEVDRCSRYFQKTYNLDTEPGEPSETSGQIVHPSSLGTESGDLQANDAFIHWSFPTRMRKTPTVVVYSPDLGNSGMVTSSEDGDLAADTPSPGETGVSVRVVGEPDNQTEIAMHCVAEADLGGNDREDNHD